VSGDVAGYYDSNTRRFLRVDRGRRVHSMHRELWGPGVATPTDAADHVNCLLADAIDELVSSADPVVFDFGCGVGGTLFHLARRFPRARLTGVTVSPRQVEVAERLAGRLDLDRRCSILLGDFQGVELGHPADAIVAVEAFAHSDSADVFAAAAARHLKPGGVLLVADDFLASDRATLGPRERRVFERFRAGWRVPAVCTVDRFVGAAVDAGFEPIRATDLSGLTRPGSRVRDRLVAAVAPPMSWLRLERVPFCGNIIGGNALQTGLREGFLRYQLVALRRVA